MFGIKGKVVLVTGASSGIGRPQRAISPKSGPAWSWRHMRIMSSLSGRAAASAVLLSVGALGGEGVPQAWTKEKCMQDVVGLWVNPDGHIRLELLPDGRYDEARGARRSAYTGRWSWTAARSASSTILASQPPGRCPAGRCPPDRTRSGGCGRWSASQPLRAVQQGGLLNEHPLRRKPVTSRP